MLCLCFMSGNQKSSSKTVGCYLTIGLDCRYKNSSLSASNFEGPKLHPVGAGCNHAAVRTSKDKSVAVCSYRAPRKPLVTRCFCHVGSSVK